MPHELGEKHLMGIISICSSNLARHKNELFLDHLVTEDKKCISTWLEERICLQRGNTTIHIQSIRRRLCCVVGERARIQSMNPTIIFSSGAKEEGIKEARVESNREYMTRNNDSPRVICPSAVLPFDVLVFDS
ncbi:hypothetical protein TNCV_3990741 [Trichonephila clavipes]|uniref:Uncharacterized protein n=1 Tax=Trichonephila clavipes TaxID=2585209 RepID=A0A8X6T120_TRICX|nr:hypothetical protein TNCV_3990741 [Trichonephila clavipes]